MKILVTGAAGFLGSWLAEKLLDLGHQVVGVDNMVGGQDHNVFPIQAKGCDFRGAVDVQFLSPMVNVSKGCDVVYHCAALAYEGLSVFSPSMIVDNIVGGTVSVATAAIRNGVKRFVNCSSMARYGRNTWPYHEEMTPNPVDPYGAAKVAAEVQLNLLGDVHGMKVIHAVPHNIYGPRQKYDDPFRNVAAIFVNRMLQHQQPIIYGDGGQTRCFSYIDDVLPTMLAMLDYDGQHGEVFNVGPNHTQSISVLDLGRMVARILDTPYMPIHYERRPCEVREAVCSSKKIERMFGFRKETTLESGLRQLIDYVRERGPKPFVYHLPIEIDSPKVPRTWKERLM